MKESKRGLNWLGWVGLPTCCESPEEWGQRARESSLFESLARLNRRNSRLKPRWRQLWIVTRYEQRREVKQSIERRCVGPGRDPFPPGCETLFHFVARHSSMSRSVDHLGKDGQHVVESGETRSIVGFVWGKWLLVASESSI